MFRFCVVFNLENPDLVEIARLLQLLAYLSCGLVCWTVYYSNTEILCEKSTDGKVLEVRQNLLKLLIF